MRQEPVMSTRFESFEFAPRLRVRTLTSDADHRPWMVFLHEGLGCIEMWKEFPARFHLETGMNCLVFDRTGYGESSPLENGNKNSDYLITEARDRLPELLDRLGIRQASFFGHSDGGTIALMFAALYPERVDGLIIEACHVYVDDLTVTGITHAREAFESGRLKERLAIYHGENTEFMFYRWADTWLSEEHRSWQMFDQLETIRTPMLIIQGRGDSYGTIGQVHAIQKRAPGHCLTEMIPDCRHIPHLETPDTVLDAVNLYLQRFAPYA